jgi:uncharacterized protein YndB with AHSA1/START domain
MMDKQNPDRIIRGEVVVEASLDEVWEAWTTKEGLQTFFAPVCEIELRVGGRIEILFDPDAPEGERGAEDTHIMAFQPRTMLAFTWNAPPSMPEIRHHRTHVVIRFSERPSGRSKVTLFHDGWGEGEHWDAAFDYFVRAWNQIVLPRLQHRFSQEPVDWQNPPALPAL